MPRPTPPSLAVDVFLVDEVATALRCSKRMIYRLIERKQLRGLRLGRRVVVPRSAIDEFLNAPATRNGSAGADADTPRAADARESEERRA